MQMKVNCVVLDEKLLLLLIHLHFTDVFHWDCINQLALKLPQSTPPSGFTCPTCKVCFNFNSIEHLCYMQFFNGSSVQSMSATAQEIIPQADRI